MRVAAPGGLSVVEGGIPATDLQLEIARANPVRDDLEPVLPDPLADTRLDFQVDPASALAYEVKAGEYIQIIDVQGRQCSDFLAFSEPKLQQGKERGLDSTTTRSLMGNAYPAPGLSRSSSTTTSRRSSRSCGTRSGATTRSGSPATRSTTRTWATRARQLHGQLQRAALPYRIEARRGWPAINFFFNTGFDAHNLYVTDEPWSRPGDYVLLRASTDLVCLSSACPDDIDPANAWNPTEIHVRVYPATNRFSAAIAHRVTPDAEPKLTKETGFHERPRR